MAEKDIFKKIYLLIVVLGLIAFEKANAQNDNEDEYEPFSISVIFENTGMSTFSAMYSETKGVYLPVTAIFDYLKISRSNAKDEKVVSGFFVSETMPYEINMEKRLVVVGNKQVPLGPDDFIYDTGQLFLRKTIFEQAFGFKVKFDFRSLSANVRSDVELPLTRILKAEKLRENLRKIQDIEAFDSIIPRQYHWFKAGMTDWSVASNWQYKYTSDFRYGLSLGAELLGGETDLFLNYSSRDGFNKREQRYYWRWVDNSFSAIRQVQVGRVYSRSIATVLSPVDGFEISNAPTTVRKALGDYIISNYTNPEWVVELYINNVLTDYKTADASGFYSFKVPVVYGTSRITLRFYGPNGEERSEEKILNMPFNFLPKGEFEYHVTGGNLLDSAKTNFIHSEVNYGLARGITIGGGYEYLSSITNQPGIPFATLNIQPFSRLILTGEYASKVRTKAAMNLNIGGGSLDASYTWYSPGQTAIIYNYKEERLLNLSLPFTRKLFSGFARVDVRQNVYDYFTYTSANLLLSLYRGPFNVNLMNTMNRTNMSTSNVYSNLTFGFHFWKNGSFRPSVQYNYTNNEFISYKAEFEKPIFRNAYLMLGFENNIVQKYSSFNLAFRWELSALSGYVSSYFNKKTPQLAASVRGGLAFDSGHNHVCADSREMVGRSGISIMAFVDMNFNGVKDPNEPYAKKFTVRCNGGKVFCSEQDTVTRITGLEPFTDYIVHLDESQFENISWRLTKKDIKVHTDPNQFKQIVVSIRPMGEISGMVADKDTGRGKGRLLISFTNEQGVVVAQTQSEGDGYFSYLGLPPGKYKVAIDREQMRILNLISDSVSVKLKEDVQGDSKDIGTLYFRHPRTLKSSIKTDEKASAIPAKTTESKVSEEKEAGTLLRLMILFDFNKYQIRNEYEETLVNMARLFKEHECLKLEIQGHTDSIGGEDYNLRLSEQRAKSVFDHLYSLGVKPDRMKANGLGKKMPVSPNKTEEGRAKNRNVVFVDISGPNCINVDSVLNILNSQSSGQIDNIRKPAEKDVSSTWPATSNRYSVFYSKGQYKLNDQNYLLINALIDVLKKNNNLVLEILACNNTPENLKRSLRTSESRVQSVVDYMVNSGVNQSQLRKVTTFGPSDNTWNRVVMRFVNRDQEVNLDDQVFGQMKKINNNGLKKYYIRNVDGKYMIQLGAFVNQEQASALYGKLKALFPENTFEEQEDNYYKVRMGYVKKYAEAVKVISYIYSSAILDVY